jgi:hypothetical protein
VESPGLVEQVAAVVHILTMVVVELAHKEQIILMVLEANQTILDRLDILDSDTTQQAHSHKGTT